ncbi:MAG: patatin-like phospholipase family protein, partial [Chromatiales bacterium]|nr:patatin-like phospholipase family protein [Chromatiales bacterium]
MSYSPLKLRAGAAALAQIRRDGFAPEAFSVMAGASGGPKWLVLSQLDRVLAPWILEDRVAPLFLLGSSIGAWRFACLAQSD